MKTHITNIRENIRTNLIQIDKINSALTVINDSLKSDLANYYLLSRKCDDLVTEFESICFDNTSSHDKASNDDIIKALVGTIEPVIKKLNLFYNSILSKNCEYEKIHCNDQCKP